MRLNAIQVCCCFYEYVTKMMVGGTGVLKAPRLLGRCEDRDAGQLPKTALAGPPWTSAPGRLHLCPGTWAVLVTPAAPRSLWASVCSAAGWSRSWCPVCWMLSQLWWIHGCVCLCVCFIVPAFWDPFWHLYHSVSLELPSWETMRIAAGVLGGPGFTWQPQGLRGSLSHVPLIDIRFTTVDLGGRVGPLCFNMRLKTALKKIESNTEMTNFSVLLSLSRLTLQPHRRWKQTFHNENTNLCFVFGLR